MRIERNFAVTLVQKSKYSSPLEKEARVKTTDLLSAYSLIKRNNKGWSFELKDIKECNLNWETIETETFKKEKEFVAQKKADFEKLGINV